MITARKAEKRTHHKMQTLGTLHLHFIDSLFNLNNQDNLNLVQMYFDIYERSNIVMQKECFIDR